MEKPGTWNLDTLPLEVWRQVAPKLTAIDVCTLLAVGSRMLAYKLKNPTTLSSISYIGAQDLEYEPYLVAGVETLETLELKNVAPPTVQRVMQTALKCGHFGKLRSLEIKADNALSIWRPGEAAWTEQAEHDQRTNLAQVMPFLTHLHLQCPIGRNEHAFKTLQSQLPTTLLSLGLPGNVPPLFGPLRNLTSLFMPMVPLLSLDTVNDLPKTLTRIECACNSNEHIEWDDAMRILTECTRSRIGPSMTFEQVRQLLSKSDPDHEILELATKMDLTDPMLGEVTKFGDLLDRLHSQRLQGFGATHLLPRLKHFHVHCDHRSTGDFVRLPSQLETFCLPDSQYAAIPIASATLPRALTHVSLECSILDATTGALEQFPPNTSTLKLGRISTKLPNFLSNLPQSITYLSLCTMLLTPKDHLHLLPPLLTTLKIPMSSLFAKEISLLPPRLTSFMAMSINRPYDDSGFVSDFTPEDDVHVKPQWPQGLVKLKFRESPFTVQTLSHLPRSVHTFFFHCLTVTDSFFADLFERHPDMLETLTDFSEDSLVCVVRRYHRLYGTRVVQKFVFNISERALQHLAPRCANLRVAMPIEGLNNFSFQAFAHLRTLQLVNLNQSKTASSYSYRNGRSATRQLSSRAVNDEIVCNLPAIEELVLKQVPHSFFTERIFYLVPKSLRRLEIGELNIRPNCFTLEWPINYARIDIPAMQRYVQNIISLSNDRFSVHTIAMPPENSNTDFDDHADGSFAFPQHVTEIDLPSDLGTPLFYASMPPNLQSLVLTHSSALIDDLVLQLPRSLTLLTLTNDKNLTSAAFNYLPPTLLHLKLATNSNINDFGMALLPRTLMTLELPCADDLTDFGMETLPPNLEVLNVATARISHRCFFLLPRSLTVLDISGNERMMTGSPTGLPSSLTVLNAPENIVTMCTKADFPKLNFVSTHEFIKGVGEGMSLFDDIC